MSAVISLSSLANADYELSRIFVLRQHWKNGEYFRMAHPRPTHALLLFTGCDAVFESAEGERQSVPCGSLFYLAQGDKYTWTFWNKKEQETSTLLFEFLPTGASVLLGKSGIIDSEGVHFWRTHFEKLLGEFEKPLISYPALKAAAFSLTAACGTHIQRKNTAPPFSYILPAVRYLEEDPEQKKSIREIAALCNISVNYFERLFFAYAGMSPQKFRLQQKTEKAKRLLESQTLGIEEIAFSLGFEDAAYFCRVFKKMTALTPSEYRKQSGSSSAD